jgi:hypothetical protein
MLYKRKQVYWVDGYVGDKRINICTEFKDKERAREFYLRLIKKSMITERLGTSIPPNSKS